MYAWPHYGALFKIATIFNFSNCFQTLFDPNFLCCILCNIFKFCSKIMLVAHVICSDTDLFSDLGNIYLQANIFLFNDLYSSANVHIFKCHQIMGIRRLRKSLKTDKDYHFDWLPSQIWDGCQTVSWCSGSDSPLEIRDSYIWIPPWSSIHGQGIHPNFHTLQPDVNCIAGRIF